MFKFIVHCLYVAVDAILLGLMGSLATKGDLSRAHCYVSLLLCAYRTAFSLDNKELQAVTALGGSLWKAWCEELGRTRAALFMTQDRNDPTDAKGLGQSSCPAARKSSVSPYPPGPPRLCVLTPLAPLDRLQQGGQVGWYGLLPALTFPVR